MQPEYLHNYFQTALALPKCRQLELMCGAVIGEQDAAVHRVATKPSSRAAAAAALAQTGLAPAALGTETRRFAGKDVQVMLTAPVTLATGYHHHHCTLSVITATSTSFTSLWRQSNAS